MHITELANLKNILYFEGNYALFRAEDKQGMFRGVINRRGEIVWNDHWRHIVMRVHGYPHIFKTVDDTREYVYYDVEKHAFVEAPVLDEGVKSQARMIVDNASQISFFKHVPELFSYPSLRYLSDAFIGFSTEKMFWGVKDLEGNIVFPAGFTALFGGGEPNHFVVSLDKREGVIDDKRQWIIPMIYDSLHWRRAYYVAYLRKGNKEPKAGLLDKSGNVLVPFEYDFLDPAYTEELISAKRGDQFLFINSKNEIIDLFNH